MYSLQDATIFASYCELLYTNFGLAPIWVGRFSDVQVVNVLESHVPPHLIEKSIALIGIGYSKERPSLITQRIPIKDLVYSLE
ncbi:MAG: hypothetical protein ACFFB5_12860 [Promethearchaeota archaeon]